VTERADEDNASPDEIRAWKARIKELEARVASLEADLQEAREALDGAPKSVSLEKGVSLNVLRALIDHTPSLMSAKDMQGRVILANQPFANLFGLQKEELLGKTYADLFEPDLAKVILEADAQVMASGKSIEAEDRVEQPDGARTFLTLKFPIFHHGTMVALGVICTDITARKELEIQAAAVRDQIIAAQKQTIRELVTPLLPIEHGVIAMPLVGAIDAERAQEVLDTLLAGVAGHAATIAILDITGVREVDAQVAQALVQAAQATQLLGAQVVITGIRPTIAQTLVEMDADMKGIITRSTLRSGIAYALGKVRGK